MAEDVESLDSFFGVEASPSVARDRSTSFLLTPFATPTPTRGHGNGALDHATTIALRNGTAPLHGTVAFEDRQSMRRLSTSPSTSYPLLYPLLCLNRAIGLYIAPIHRRAKAYSPGVRYSKGGVAVCLLMLSIHLIMGVDDLVVLLTRLQVDGLFHLETLIAALVSTFQWHAILIILNHLATFKCLYSLIGRIPSHESRKQSSASSEEQNQYCEFRRAYTRKLGCLTVFSVLISISFMPLSVMLFIHLSEAELSFNLMKDCLILVGPTLMTSELLGSVLLFVALSEIIGHCFDRFHLHVAQIRHIPHFSSIRHLKSEFFELVDLAQAMDSVFTWSNFLSIVFGAMNISLSVFTYIHLNETEAQRYKEFGMTPIWVLGILNALQMYLIMAILVTGTRFNNRSRAVKDELLRLDFDPVASDKHALYFELDNVIRKVHERDWGLTAGKFFLIDQSTMLTIIGMIVTYVTVLVQIGWNAPSAPHNLQRIEFTNNSD